MVKIQPAVMPVTPLARGMWRFGGCALMGSEDMTKIQSVPAPHANAQGYTHSRETVAVLQVAFERKNSTSTDSSADALQVPERSGTKRYESVDGTGRVWGMPSAFGGGQCLDCSNKAVPPSMRCFSCQQKLNQGKPMSAEGLQQLQSSFNTLLHRFSGKKHEDLENRLDQLYLLLQGGKIAEYIEAKLHHIANAISANDCTEATRLVTALSAEHWDQHKSWLLGLRRLLSK